MSREPRLTRRQALRAGGGLLAAAGLSPYGRAISLATAAGTLRRPGSLPDPSRPAGTPTAALPFDHLVVVMMENHSFDNYLGMLPRRGQPLADGFRFDAAGRPLNANPVKGGYITVQHALSDCTPDGGGSQTWSDTHRQINGGRMDGFAATGQPSMTYWDESDLPFYYSIAKTFCLANRWFASAPAQTYPNRRFLLAGTAFGLISTDNTSILQNPPNGTIVDRLNAYGISWTDYFTDVPATGVIESIPQNNPTHLASVQQFYLDCAAGTLPAVSFVDSDIGAAHEVGSRFPPPFGPSNTLNNQDQDEEYGDLSLGENFVSQVTNAVLGSPLWPRILLVWTYDEHGGWYDHVPPPAAIPPDNIPPQLGPGDPPGGYDIYGVRVPAVVVSGHARPRSVTNVVHDHTSILATIESKWNLPAMTFRDANAATMADFLSPTVTFPEPPQLASPSDATQTESSCTTNPPHYQVKPAGSAPAPQHVPVVRIVSAVSSRDRRTLTVRLRTDRGTLDGLTLELRGPAGRLIARAGLAHLGPRPATVRLHRRARHPLPAGHMELIVRRGGHGLARRLLTVRG